jgi:hypothetical protein
VRFDEGDCEVGIADVLLQVGVIEAIDHIAEECVGCVTSFVEKNFESVVDVRSEVVEATQQALPLSGGGLVSGWWIVSDV